MLVCKKINPNTGIFHCIIQLISFKILYLRGRKKKEDLNGLLRSTGLPLSKEANMTLRVLCIII